MKKINIYNESDLETLNKLEKSYDYLPPICNQQHYQQGLNKACLRQTLEIAKARTNQQKTLTQESNLKHLRNWAANFNK